MTFFPLIPYFNINASSSHVKVFLTEREVYSYCYLAFQAMIEILWCASFF